MQWMEVLVEFVIFPLLIIYGFTSYAKDHPGESFFKGFDESQNCNKKSNENDSHK